MNDLKLPINFPKKFADYDVNFSNKTHKVYNYSLYNIQNDIANFSLSLNPSNNYLYKSKQNVNFYGKNTINLPVKDVQEILDKALPLIKNAKNPKDKAKLCAEALDNFYNTQMNWKKSINNIENQKDHIDFINDFLHEAFSHLLELQHIYIEPFMDKEKSLPKKFDTLCENNFSSIKEVYQRYQFFLENGLNIQSCSLSEILNMVKNPLDKTIKEKDLTLTIFGEDLINKPGIIPNISDYKVYTIFMNLLQNAVKYTPNKGYIVLVFSKNKLKPSLINFSIQDDGIGIPPSEIRKILKGSRGSNAINSGISGTGYGLRRVDRILNFVGLKLKIISPIDQNSSIRPGTKIICQIPIKEVST